MTPPEVVDFMVEVALHELSNQPRKKSSEIVVADPCCGVGSFLATFAQGAHRLGLKKTTLIGQDKVPRMVRLAAINLALFGTQDYAIFAGNSLESGSALSDFNGRVDVVLTNPPFGARFPGKLVQEYGQANLPFFFQISQRTSNIDSELLFIDRDLELLRDGGHLLIVVPDSVVSGKGLQVMLRHNLLGRAALRAVIELPSVTFAQAGTRTKTAILCLQKNAKTLQRRSTFFADVADLGFSVSSRKGVPIKRIEGTNELIASLASFKAATADGVSVGPPSVEVTPDHVTESSWNPKIFLGRARQESLGSKTVGINYKTLGDVARIVTRERRLMKWRPDHTFIGVIHVLGEGNFDVAGIKSYAPKTPGFAVNPGDVLFSCINPRIPRVAVVPDFGTPTICSAEFEVMEPDSVTAYELMYLMLTAEAQQQIRHLTSGTSASHNRIRADDLSRIMLPIPKPRTKAATAFNERCASYEKRVRSLFQDLLAIAEIRENESSWLEPARR